MQPHPSVLHQGRETVNTRTQVVREALVQQHAHIQAGAIRREHELARTIVEALVVIIDNIDALNSKGEKL